MSNKILGLAFLSLSIVGCAAQAAEGEENVAQTDQAQAKRPDNGEPCGGNGGISGGRMDEYGWCCGLAPCTDPKVCGVGPVQTCLNCNVETVDCSSGNIIVGYQPPRPIDKPPVGGTPRKPAY